MKREREREERLFVNFFIGIVNINKREVFDIKRIDWDWNLKNVRVSYLF